MSINDVDLILAILKSLLVPAWLNYLASVDRLHDSPKAYIRTMTRELKIGLKIPRLLFNETLVGLSNYRKA